MLWDREKKEKGGRCNSIFYFTSTIDWQVPWGRGHRPFNSKLILTVGLSKAMPFEGLLCRTTSCCLGSSPLTLTLVAVTGPPASTPLQALIHKPHFIKH
ncbi:hypothetical protein SUGI_1150060 [Cryptomeria japonica]|nr:hypothetical protein SUGI_1150060 [Cryptomeria japonica]